MKVDVKNWKKAVQEWDERRNFLIGGEKEKTIEVCTQAFVDLAKEAIQEKDRFFVALSGGSTPRAVFQNLAREYKTELDWKKVVLFWSDERAVSPSDPESNYGMAMKAGFKSLSLDPKNIHRMKAEKKIEEEAMRYEETILSIVPEGKFDLILLGMGEDGHTASLFPRTHGLHAHEDRLVIANFIPQKDLWRMSFTFTCINQSRNTHLYVLGSNKAQTVYDVLKGPFQPDTFPVQRVGTEDHKALWIFDDAASQLL